MRQLSACLVALGLTMAVTMPLPAQDTPEDAVRQFLHRTQAGDWRSAAGFVTTETQRTFRDMTLSLLVQSAEANVRQAGGRVASPQPDGRPAAMSARLALLDTIPVVGLRSPFTLGELARLDPGALLEEALALRYSALQGREMRLLGTIEENDTTSWALLRQVIPNAPAQLASAPGMVSVAPLHRRAEGWRLGFAMGLFSPGDLVSPSLRNAQGGSMGVAIAVRPVPGSGPWPTSPAATAAECDSRRVYFRIESNLPETVSQRYTQVTEVTLITELSRSGRIVSPSPIEPADSVSVLVVTLTSVSDGSGVRIELGFRRGTTTVAGSMRSLVPMSADQVDEGAATLRLRLSDMLQGFSAGGLPGPCR